MKDHQKAMIDDGCPPKFVMMTAEERRKAWVDSPPRKSEWNMSDGKTTTEVIKEAVKEINEVAKENKIKPLTGKPDTKKAVAKVKEVAAKKKAEVKPAKAEVKSQPAKKAGGEKATVKVVVDTAFTQEADKLAAQFGVREGSARQLILKRLAANFGKPVAGDALAKVAGIGAGQVAGNVRVIGMAIDNKKLPYKIEAEGGSYAISKK